MVAGGSGSRSGSGSGSGLSRSGSGSSVDIGTSFDVEVRLSYPSVRLQERGPRVTASPVPDRQRTEPVRPPRPNGRGYLGARKKPRLGECPRMFLDGPRAVLRAALGRARTASYSFDLFGTAHAAVVD